MKLYLSSNRLGNKIDELKKMVLEPKRIAVITNAKDYAPIELRSEKLKSNFAELKAIGFDPIEVDLRKYFNQKDKLLDDLKNFNGVYVAGGNSFLLLKSFIQSGFDQVLKELLLDPSFVYIGYSAGICVLAPDLYGLEIVDDPYVKVEKYSNEIIWKGLGILEYLPVPHYKSEDKEISDGNDKVIEKLTVNGVKYTPIRDGEVVIIDNP
jgi:dipeptidase E